MAAEAANNLKAAKPKGEPKCFKLIQIELREKRLLRSQASALQAGPFEREFSWPSYPIPKMETRNKISQKRSSEEQQVKRCLSTKYTPIQKSKSHNMDLNSLINSWWVKGSTKRKTMKPTTENEHYQIKGHSEEDSTFPVQEVKVDPKPKVTTTHERAKRPRKFIPHRDPLGLRTGVSPTEYMEEVTKLIREDDILVPVSQIKAEANQKVTHNAPPPTVIELHRRLVNGTNQLFDVPKSIPAMIRSPYMQQAHGINDTCVFCKQKMHRYQFFCPRFKQLQPQEIRRFMLDYNIECKMCLGINHTTDHCKVNVKRCNIKTNGTNCGAKHCRVLHPKEGKKNKKETPQRRTCRDHGTL